MLLKIQRNELFSILIKNSLQPIDFAENNSSAIYQLNVINTPLWFNVTDNGNEHRLTSFPAMRFDPPQDSSHMRWYKVLIYFAKWASIIKEELETPDLWLEAQASVKLFALNATAPNEMFNGAELRQLEGQVRQLVQGLKALGLSANAQKLLTETANEIPEKATRFTKKELAGWFMGAFAAQVTNLALSQEHVSAIATLIKTTFMGILQLH